MSEIVAFQGEPGAYSEAAALEYHQQTQQGPVEPLPCDSFEAVFEAVQEGRAQRGVVPVENSLAGSIHRNYDLLERHQLHIIGEHALRVEHCLMALPGVTLEQLRRVLSHPQALAQCEHSLDALGLAREATYDTAGSARLISHQKLTDAAAIASQRAAQVWGLEILQQGIEDLPNNYTRFLVLAREPLPLAPDVPARTSIVFSLLDSPGVLFKALSVFALRDIDLLRIESRPLRQRRFRYLFYLDFAAPHDTEAAQNALRHLREIAPFLRVLGSYPDRTSVQPTQASAR